KKNTKPGILYRCEYALRTGDTETETSECRPNPEAACTERARPVVEADDFPRPNR
ncbi:hypothetical protein NDU88_005255, partial [Pleurodeles waltl]